jgi:hypothetical protein
MPRFAEPRAVAAVTSAGFSAAKSNGDSEAVTQFGRRSPRLTSIEVDPDVAAAFDGVFGAEAQLFNPDADGPFATVRQLLGPWLGDRCLPVEGSEPALVEGGA